MQDGSYVIYTIRFCRIAESPWGKPEGKLKPIKREAWHFIGSDGWGRSINPHIGTGNDWRPKYRKACEELREVQRRCGYTGWFNLKYAISAVKRLVEDSEKGVYDSTDHYKHKMAACRYAFQLVKITLQHKTEVLGTNEDSVFLQELIAAESR